MTRPQILAASFFVCAVVTLAISPATAREWTVRLDGSGNFTRIQSAIDIARGGDVILVGPGVYSFGNQGFANDDPLNDHVMLEIPRRAKSDFFKIVSEDGPEATILGGAGKGQILIIRGENSDGIAGHFQFVEIEGFTFRFGKSVNPLNEGVGGAVMCHLTSTRFTNCIFEGNEAENEGAALWWGGISEFVIRDSIFRDNHAGGFGGAICYINSPSNVSRIINCRFEGNTSALAGGAVFHWNVATNIENCVFVNNSADDLGGAIYYGGSQPCEISRTTIVESAANAGGGIALRTRPVNQGGQPVDRPSLVTLEQSIISHTRSGGAAHADADSRLDVECTLMYSNQGGGWPDTLTGDPAYCDRAGGDFAVCEDSAARPAHNSCGIRLGAATGVCADCSPPPPPGGGTPVAATLHPNQPNPFNPGTDIRFELNQPTRVRLAIYDVRGRHVVTLFDDFGIAGANGPMHWDGTDASGARVASGLYTYRLESETDVQSRKMLLLK